MTKELYVRPLGFLYGAVAEDAVAAGRAAALAGGGIAFSLVELIEGRPGAARREIRDVEALLGSFSSQENAENLAADLRRQGFAAFLSQHSGSSGQLHRVRVGPQRDREEAEAMAARLSLAGHGGQVVPHP